MAASPAGSAAPAAPAASVAPALGYSDRVHHALAYAAKHHDREVRKGTRTPYFTTPASVAVILTRYGRDEDTVVAGVLQPAVEDLLRDGESPDGVRARLTDKFGPAAVDAVLGAARRRYDDDGVELSYEEQRTDALARFRRMGDASRWAFAAHEVHDASALLADLRRTQFPDAVWGRFAEGRGARARWYAQAAEGLAEAGFDAAVTAELRAAAEALAEHAAAPAGR